MMKPWCLVLVFSSWCSSAGVVATDGAGDASCPADGSGGPACEAGGATGLKEEVLGKMKAIYQDKNPDKLDEIEPILAKWQGREAELYMKLSKKYGIEPVPPLDFILAANNATVDLFADKSQCEAWAKRCECEFNPNFMLKDCKRSCAIYGGECVDSESKACKASVGKQQASGGSGGCKSALWNRCTKSCANAQREQQKAPKKTCKRIFHPGGLQDMNVSRMFGRIADEGWAAEHEPEVISRDPWILFFNKLFSDDIVDTLMSTMFDLGAYFAASGEISSSEVNERKRRTSDTMFCSSSKCIDHPKILAAHSIVTNITGLQLGCHELMQIVRYQVGQYYVEHQDTSNDYGASAAGHRIYTLFVYLTDLPEGAGGETHFPRLNIKVKPKKGGAVLWTNVQQDNPRREDLRTKHEGLPVIEKTWPNGEVGTKIATNMWLYGYDWRWQWSHGCMNVAAGY